MKGYKPIRHRACDTQLAWVKDKVTNGMRMLREDIKDMSGSKLLPLAKISSFYCDRCRYNVKAREWRI